MKNKVTISISAFLLCFAMLGGLYYFKVYKSIKVVNIDANYITYETEKEMSNSADIILYGTPIDKFEDRKHVNTYMPNGSLSDFYTLTKFNIKKIIKKPSALDIKKSDLFDIIEPIGVIQDAEGQKILKSDAYEAMVQNENYIVYLKSNNMGGYSVINMSNGRFNLSKDESKDDAKHMKLKTEVLKSYSDNLN